MKQSNTVRVRTSLWGALLFLIAASIFWMEGRPVRTVSANRIASTAPSACPAGKYCSFLPLVSAPVAGDLVLDGIEVTQAVQNPQNNVHLVAGRPTILRIYANTRDFNRAVSNVKISVKASSPGATILSDSPKTYYATVPLSSSRADYNSSINIALPATWLTGSMDLTVQLNPESTIRESNNKNNSITQHLVFNPVPTLRVKIIPILYHHVPDGHIYAAPTKDMVSDWIKRTYPISNIELTWHAPYTFSGDLTTFADFSKLLNEITTVKSTEGAPASQVYYGLVPTRDGTSAWFYGGYAGLGWVGSRAAIGLDYEDQTSQLAAHEIGHNLGALHTPCDVTSGLDANYPYPDGTIGQYGLDVTSGMVYNPSYKDVMSYCNPKWISDYTYEKLYAGQVQSGASTQMSITAADPASGGSQRGLLVRANVVANGVELLPAYVIPGQVREASEPGEYLVEVLGEQGEIIAQAPVRAYQAMEPGEGQVTAIHAMIALPGQPAARLRLLKGGQVLAEEPLQPAVTSQEAGVMVEQAKDGNHLRWNPHRVKSQQAASQTSPVLVRYSADGGQTWTTLGVDVTSGDILLPATLPGNATFEVINAGNWK